MFQVHFCNYLLCFQGKLTVMNDLHKINFHKHKFYFEYHLENDKLKIMIKKKTNEALSRRTDLNYKINLLDGHGFKIDQIIQTKEMTKEVLYSMTKKLKFNMEIFDCDNAEQTNYLHIILPVE